MTTTSRIGVAALSLSLLLHELATNAVKYGALSADAGHVEVRWSVDGEAFKLSWREFGGPPPAAPDRRGFGSRLIGMGINGTRGAELRYEADGLRADFTAPLSSVVDA